MPKMIMNKKILVPFFLFTLVREIVFGPTLVRAADTNSYWNACPAGCLGLAVPQFQDDIPAFEKKINSGKEWERNIGLEKAALAKMIKISCPNYLANPNGDNALTKFTAEYSQVALSALQTKQQADSIAVFFDAESRIAKQYLLKFGVLYESTPCAKALDAAKTHMSSEEAEIVAQFELLKSKCPQIASANTAAAISDRKAKAAPSEQIAPSNGKAKGKPQNQGNSTITGVEENKKKEAQ